jgi:hypothetical protein
MKRAAEEMREAPSARNSRRRISIYFDFVSIFCDSWRTFCKITSKMFARESKSNKMCSQRTACIVCVSWDMIFLQLAESTRDVYFVKEASHYSLSLKQTQVTKFCVMLGKWHKLVENGTKQTLFFGTQSWRNDKQRLKVNIFSSVP